MYLGNRGKHILIHYILEVDMVAPLVFTDPPVLSQNLWKIPLFATPNPQIAKKFVINNIFNLILFIFWIPWLGVTNGEGFSFLALIA